VQWVDRLLRSRFILDQSRAQRAQLQGQQLMPKLVQYLLQKAKRPVHQQAD
jgi:hypothetical protein